MRGAEAMQDIAAVTSPLIILMQDSNNNKR